MYFSMPKFKIKKENENEKEKDIYHSETVEYNRVFTPKKAEYKTDNEIIYAKLIEIMKLIEANRLEMQEDIKRVYLKLDGLSEAVANKKEAELTSLKKNIDKNTDYLQNILMSIIDTAVSKRLNSSSAVEEYIKKKNGEHCPKLP